MNVSTISIPKEDALKAYREYRDAVKQATDAEQTHEDAAIAAAMKAIAQGQAVVDLLDAFREAGLDEFARPRLAMARVDVTQIAYNCFQSSSTPMFEAFPVRKHRGRYKQTMFCLPAGFYTKGIDVARWTAVVPIVPPRFRPPKSQLRKYWVLWHPEWKAPPRDKDPMLLRRLSNYLFVVVAAWDLTEVEMAVLRRRLF
jgi:hypothetical protein